MSQFALADSRHGWGEYTRYLIELAGDAREQERQEFPGFEIGWAIGTGGWRQTLAHTYSHRALEQGIARSELREIKEARWRNALDCALEASGKTAANISENEKGARWKIRIAQRLRRQFAAPHRWIAEHLNMGTPAAVRVNVARLR